MSTRSLRREHQLRADRLEARFDPLNPNEPNAGKVTSPVATPVPVRSTSTPPAATSAAATAASAVPTTNTLLQAAPTSAAPVSTAVVVVPPTNATSSILPASLSSSTLLPTSSLVQATAPLVAASQATTTSHTPTFSIVPVATFATLSSGSVASATSSSTSAPSSGMGVGSIAGIAAGSIAGIAILGVVGMWLIKRYSQSKDDDASDATPFTRHSWMRNSVVLPDDSPAPPRAPSANPRPPTMIERKQANLAGRGYPQGGFPGYGQGGYGQGQPGYDPAHGGYMSPMHQNPQYGRPPMAYTPGPHLVPQQQQRPFSPIASPPLSPSTIDMTAPPVSYNNAPPPVYFTRHDTVQAEMQSQGNRTLPNPYENSQGVGYATLDRSSVTPYQAKQYAEISRQLEGTGPMASPFDDPTTRVDSTPPVLPAMRAMSPVGGAIQGDGHMSPPPGHGFAVPSPITIPSPASPKSPSFKAMPMSPSVITVPADMHVGRETPVQFGFNEPALGAAAVEISPPAAAVVKNPMAPNPRRMSMASRKSTGRPETMYDEEDAYGGI